MEEGGAPLFTGPFLLLKVNRTLGPTGFVNSVTVTSKMAPINFPCHGAASDGCGPFK